jgi:photosystem II stability/assembly factor-like uncharacterized protein
LRRFKLRQLALLGSVVILLGALAVITARSTGALNRTRTCQPRIVRGTAAIQQLLTGDSSRGELYAVTGGGRLFTLTTEGKWAERPVRVPGRLEYISAAKVLYTSASTGIFKSADDGRSWQPFSCGWVVTQIAPAPSRPRWIYVGTAQRETARNGGGLYLTKNGGRSWARYTAFAQNRGGDPSVESLAIDPLNPEVVFVGLEAGGLQVSRNAGRNWTLETIAHVNGLLGPQITTIEVGAGKKLTIWIGSRRHGIFSRSGSGHWIPRGLQGHWIYSLVLDPKAPRLLMANTDVGPLRTIDAGDHWHHLYAEGVRIAGVVSGPRGALYGWANRMVFRSNNQGTSWRLMSRLPAN